MLTRLRSRKERAYWVDLELEERTVYLPSSPHAVAWDPVGRRVLYHRADWIHKVIKGTDEIYDPGILRTVICEAPEGDLPLDSLAAGRVWAVLATDDAPDFSESEPYIGDPRVECMAVDPVAGHVVVCWHRESVFAPFESITQVFSPTGSILGSHHQAQPDELLRWQVPHALVSGGFVYAVERDEDLDGTGRVVRRGVGTIGTISATWSPNDPWTFVHSLAINPDTETLYVLATRLWGAGTGEAFQRSYLIALDTGNDLDFRWQVELTFNLESGPYPYFMGQWEPAGGPNSGGMFFRDIDGTFVSSAQDPTTYDPDPLVPLERKLFRWIPAGGGVVIEGLGEIVPCPIFPILDPSSPEPTTSAVLGAWFAELPQIQEV